MTAQKKEGNKKNRISFKESTTKLSDKQKSLSYLDYLQTVQSFYSSDRDLYSRTLVFFFIIHFKGINSNKNVMVTGSIVLVR